MTNLELSMHSCFDVLEQVQYIRDVKRVGVERWEHTTRQNGRVEVLPLVEGRRAEDGDLHDLGHVLTYLLTYLVRMLKRARTLSPVGTRLVHADALRHDAAAHTTG